MNRDVLQAIRDDALDRICKGTSKRWVRAWQNLADAADTLDAMIARTEVPHERQRGS